MDSRRHEDVEDVVCYSIQCTQWSKPASEVPFMPVFRSQVRK